MVQRRGPRDVTVRHDVQQRLQRRAGQLDAAVVEINFGHALLRGDDIVHAIRENGQVLQFRAQHFLGEDGVRMIEDAAEEGADETAPLMR